MTWDGVERRRHERYVIRLNVDWGVIGRMISAYVEDMANAVAIGDSVAIPYRERKD